MKLHMEKKVHPHLKPKSLSNSAPPFARMKNCKKKNILRLKVHQYPDLFNTMNKQSGREDICHFEHQNLHEFESGAVKPALMSPTS